MGKILLVPLVLAMTVFFAGIGASSSTWAQTPEQKGAYNGTLDLEGVTVAANAINNSDQAKQVVAQAFRKATQLQDTLGANQTVFVSASIIDRVMATSEAIMSTNPSVIQPILDKNIAEELAAGNAATLICTIHKKPGWVQLTLFITPK